MSNLRVRKRGRLSWVTPLWRVPTPGGLALCTPERECVLEKVVVKNFDHYLFDSKLLEKSSSRVKSLLCLVSKGMLARHELCSFIGQVGIVICETFSLYFCKTKLENYYRFLFQIQFNFVAGLHLQVPINFKCLYLFIYLFVFMYLLYNLCVKLLD